MIAKRPYNLFLFTSILLLLASICMLGQTLDIHLHDTYYIFPATYFALTIALIFLIAWTIYKLTGKYLLTKYLTWFHVLATLIVAITLMTRQLWHDNPISTNNKPPVAFKSFFEIQRKDYFIALTISLLFVAGQIGYIINIVGGLIRRR